MMLSSLILTSAVGHNPHDGGEMFDDLKTVGLWPMTETIGKIVKVSLWVGAARVFAIETSYKIVNDDKHVAKAIHGKKYGTKVSFKANSHEVFVGIFGTITGSTDESQNESSLGSVGFLLFDTLSGDLLVKGPQPDIPTGKALQRFLSLGRIVGFSGSLRPDFTIANIAVYKFPSGAVNMFDEEEPKKKELHANALHLQGECWLSTT